MPAWQENPHPWQMRPRVGHLLPAMGANKAAGSVAGGRDFRRLYQLAAGMTGGSQFSSFYDLHAQASLRDCQPASRCRLRPGVTANFEYFSSPQQLAGESVIQRKPEQLFPIHLSCPLRPRMCSNHTPYRANSTSLLTAGRAVLYRSRRWVALSGVPQAFKSISRSAQR